tara:strand:+ start:5852 stop:6265 length:414 start_codon:yes stop_codon:yes gene_type:complete
MKKGKIVVLSILGLAIMTVGYFVMKKRNKLKESEEIEEEVEEDVKEMSFSEKIITNGKALRVKINKLRSGKDENTQMELVTLLSKLNTADRKGVWDWYNYQNYSVLGDLRGALEKVLSPLWSDRAERTMMNWKLNGR